MGVIQLLFAGSSLCEDVRQILLGARSPEVSLDCIRQKEEYIRALSESKYAAILFEHETDGWDVFQALDARRLACPDTPFICIANVDGDVAVEMIKRGATDFVLKNRLSRLPFALNRALEVAEDSPSPPPLSPNPAMDIRIRQVNESLKEAQRIAQIGSWEWELSSGLFYLSDEAYRIIGMEPTSHPIATDALQEFIVSADKDRVTAAMGRSLSNRIPLDELCRIRTLDGKIKNVHLMASARCNALGQTVVLKGTIQDVSERLKAQQEIQRITSHMQDAQRIAHIGSWEWNIAQDSVYWSEEMYRLLGYEPGGTTPCMQIYLTHAVSEDADKVGAALGRSTSALEPFDIEFRILTANGEMRYIRSKARIEADETGAPLRMTGTMHDITDRKLIELELVKLKNRLEEAQHIAHIGSMEWDAFLDRLEWSDEVYRIYGMDKDSTEVRPGIGYTLMDDRDRAKVAGAWQRAIEAREPFDETYWIRTPDGEGKCIQFRAYPKMDSLGVLLGFAGTIQDITDKKNAEGALRLANESNRMVLDSISDGMAMYDYDGKILNINQVYAETLGKPVEEVIGTHLTDYYPPEKYDDFGRERLGQIRLVFKSGTKLINETERDGKWFRNRFYPVKKCRKVTAVTLFTTDITDQKRAEEEAHKRADSEARLSVMTEFFTNVSHELNTPIALILMQLDMMRMRLNDPDKLKELLENATLNSFRLTRLVSNLLDITKMDAGFLQANLRNVDLVSILGGIHQSVKEYAQAKGIELNYVSDVDIKCMDIDSDKMERAVLNLLSNAIKNTPAGGKICLSLIDRGDRVLIRVQDTGEGIPKDRVDKVFDRFVQVNNSLKRQTEGFGIGLALVKSMAELHRGTVSVESEVGQGSIFTIELPVLTGVEKSKMVVFDGFDIHAKVKMELADLYIKAGTGAGK